MDSFAERVGNLQVSNRASVIQGVAGPTLSFINIYE